MQKLTLILLSNLLFSNELQWVDTQINSIIPPRIGLDTSTLNKLKDPFIDLHAKKVKAPKGDKKLKTKKLYTPFYHQKPHLDAILNNSAMIDGKWYTQGQKVQNYTIKYIAPTYVVLQHNQEELHLTTTSKNLKLKILKQ